MAAALVAVSSLCACSSLDPLRLWGPRPPPTAALGFHSWQQKYVNNAYNQRESLQEQLGLHRFRSVEIDIHQGKRGRPCRYLSCASALMRANSSLAVASAHNCNRKAR